MSTTDTVLTDTSTPDPPSAELLKRVGLTPDEYERLCGILGRKPNLVEMGICGAMWSEHCSYKTSRRHLKKLPVEGEGVLQGPGENAGAIDLGNDYAVVFKIESHNHPSAVEPFQGAATGVGGIIRDVFAMGARPVALLDSLRFGNLAELEEIKAMEAVAAAPGQPPSPEKETEADSTIAEGHTGATPTLAWNSEPKPYVTVVNWLTQMRRQVFDKPKLARRAIELLRQLDASGTRVLSYCLMPDQLLLALALPEEQSARGDDALADVIAEIKNKLTDVAREALRPGEQLWETGYRAQRKFDQSELSEAIRRLEYTPVQRGTVQHSSDYPYVSESWRTGQAFGEAAHGGESQAGMSAPPPAPGVTAEQAARNRYLLGGVVSGISHYGNCIGIPTVGGEVVFDPTYNNNCLVNAMCVGIIRKDRLLKGIAEGPGNTALMVGAKTGRDGVQGATFASVDLADDYAKLRPAVQVGDPFMEKLLLEATLEIIGLPGLVGVQDLGAAGLTCSSVEMAARAGTGMQLDLDRVPQRASDLSAYEMMLSESQERMMVVVEKGGEQPFLDVFHKWGLTAVPCGEVLPQKSLIVIHDGAPVARMPNQPLANEAPDYDRPTDEPEQHKKRRHLSDSDIEVVARRGGDTPGAMLWSLLTHPSIASKRAVFQQYDFLVRGDTVQGPGLSDAAVIRVPETGQGIVLATDGPGRETYLDPKLGGARAVLESARNVLACGARPLGITNCLNFGNPEKPDRMWQLVQAIEGMSDALRELGLPVTGGNVSLYNETGGESILPTPVIGMVGLLDDWKKYLRNATLAEGLELFVLGTGTGRLDGSALAFDIGRIRAGELHGHNYEEFRRCAKFLQHAAAEGGIAACHDISDGGLAVALFELCGAGCDVDIAHFIHADYDASEHNLLAALFGEGGHRWLVAVDSARKGWLRTAALHEGVPLVPMGRTGGGKLTIRNGDGVVIEAAMDKLSEAYDTALERLLSTR